MKSVFNKGNRKIVSMPLFLLLLWAQKKKRHEENRIETATMSSDTWLTYVNVQDFAAFHINSVYMLKRIPRVLILLQFSILLHVISHYIYIYIYIAYWNFSSTFSKIRHFRTYKQDKSTRNSKKQSIFYSSGFRRVIWGDKDYIKYDS